MPLRASVRASSAAVRLVEATAVVDLGVRCCAAVYPEDANPRCRLLASSTASKPYRDTGIALGITLSLLWKRDPRTLPYLGLQCPRWKQEHSELLEGQQQLGSSVIVKGRTLTLSVALACDGPLTEPQRSLVANKLTLYLLGGRSSESDAHTGLVLSTPTHCGGCQTQTRIANRQRRIPCMIVKERGGSHDIS